MFKDFGRKMQRDIKRISDQRLANSEKLSGGKLTVLIFLNNKLIFFLQPKPIDVQVISHKMQRYAVWFGGSMLASTVFNYFFMILVRLDTKKYFWFFLIINYVF